jgi:predicted nuclease of predicted toxin-antitoxin system
MRILFDHCVPKRLRQSFSHSVRTTREMGWEHLSNGKLLATAAGEFDVFLTVDRNLKHQQNLGALPIAVIVMIGKSNRRVDLLPLVPKVEEMLRTLLGRQLIEVVV